MEISNKNFTLKGQNDKPMAADVHFPKSSGSIPLVIYAHGINGFKDWGGMDLVARKFVKAGFAFLKFNFSHNGTSPENPTEFVELDSYKRDNYRIRQQDLKSVFDFVFEKENLTFYVSEVSLIGHSRGGADAILFAAKEKRLAKLITWSAPSNAKTPWRNWKTERLERWKTEGTMFVPNKRTGQNMPIGYQLFEEFQNHKKELDVEAAAREISIPWQICNGDSDDAVFIKNAYDLKEWQPAAKTLIIENAGHTYERSHPWEKDFLPEETEKLILRNLQFLSKK